LVENYPEKVVSEDKIFAHLRFLRGLDKYYYDINWRRIKVYL
jgi:hypothetical protein